MDPMLSNDVNDRPIMDLNPFGLEFRSNPSSFHEILFKNSPGFIMMEGVRSAFVATYDHCISVLRDFKSFSSQKPKDLPGMQRVDFFNSLPVMNYSDPPDHTRRRKVVSPAFYPKRTEMLIEGTSQLTDRLLDKILANGSMEVTGEFARPIAIDTMLRQFLGINPKDHHIFLNYVQTLPLLDSIGLHDPKPKPYLDAWNAGKEYCREQQELARRGECDNLIGLIANMAEGGALSDDEMMAMMMVMLTGGFPTIAGAISASLMNLARTPGLAERINETPSLSQNHLEETLRLNPPVSLVMRFAAKDTDVGGTLIPQGTPVYVMIAAASSDPTVFPDPYKFDVDRPNAKNHISFGTGLHTCIGNTIARPIVPLVVRKVAERAPGMRLAGHDGDIRWNLGTPRARHIERLVVTF
jgi:cytochrome P450